jgi:hypothetical protein
MPTLGMQRWRWATGPPVTVASLDGIQANKENVAIYGIQGIPERQAISITQTYTVRKCDRIQGIHANEVNQENVGIQRI